MAERTSGSSRNSNEKAGRPSQPRASRTATPSGKDKPYGDRSRGDRPAPNRSRSDKPRSDKTYGDRSRRDRPTSDRDREDRQRAPVLADEILFEDLDKSVRFELHTLPEELQQKVGRYLLAAEIAVAGDDIEGALAYARYAKKLAGRVAVVREIAGVIEYLAGEYSLALNEFRAVRRMTGSNDFIAMMADSERGLGRPERALELLKSVPVKELAPDVQVEALIVGAGARADLGQVEAALLMLNIPALTKLPVGDQRARLQEAYAGLLRLAGREEEAVTWEARALKSDVNRVTGLAATIDDDKTDSAISAEILEESD